MLNKETTGYSGESSLSLPMELLGIPNIIIKETLIDQDNQVILFVESLEEGTCCHQCGEEAHAFHGSSEEIVLRHLSIWGHEVYIRIEPKRYQCKNCGAVTNQMLPWYPQRSPHTQAYEDHLLLQLINSTVSDVCIKENIGYDEVKGVIERRIQTQVDWNEVKRIETLGIDEISFTKGHADFVTVITGYSEGNLLILGIIKGKEKEAVKAFLKSIPKRIRRKVKAVCTDMYEGFINAAKEVFSKKVKIVVDRFHVAKLYRGSVDKLRVKELKRLKK
jgi:transposase